MNSKVREKMQKGQNTKKKLEHKNVPKNTGRLDRKIKEETENVKNKKKQLHPQRQKAEPDKTYLIFTVIPVIVIAEKLRNSPDEDINVIKVTFLGITNSKIMTGKNNKNKTSKITVVLLLNNLE